MKTKHIIIATCLTAFAIPAIAQGVHRATAGHVVPTAREVDLAILKALVATAEKRGDKVAFIGGPVWSVDGTEKAKTGVYLLDDNGLITIGN